MIRKSWREWFPQAPRSSKTSFDADMPSMAGGGISSESKLPDSDPDSVQEIAPTAQTRTSKTSAYSKAYENFVEEEDDLVGLLAYALYKGSVRENARSGRHSDGSKRNPNGAEVKAYRSQAERELSGVARRAIEDATPDIEQTAIANAIKGNRTEILAHITRRTGFWSAFGTNMLAWIVSLCIAVLIIVLFNRPTVERVVSESLTPPELDSNENSRGFEEQENEISPALEDNKTVD